MRIPTSKTRIALSAASVTLALSALGLAAAQAVPADVNRTYVGDFDGDGKTDKARLVDFGDHKGIQTCGVRFELATGAKKLVKYTFDGFEPEINHLRCFDQAEVAIVDFNGDGKHELAQWWPADGYVAPSIYMSVVSLDGHRQTKAAIGADQDTRLSFADLNGDGRTDVITTKWSANSSTRSWDTKPTSWSFTNRDGEPALGKRHTLEGSGISTADIDQTSPGEELIVPLGESAWKDGKPVQTKCVIQVVRGGTKVSTHHLKGIKNCAPAESKAVDSERDGHVDTLKITWAEPVGTDVKWHVTKHKFNKRGEFIDTPAVSPKAPVAKRDYVKMSFQWGLVGKVPVLKNDKHVEGGKLSIVSGPRHGNATVEGDRVVYTRTTMKTGWDSLVYKVTTPNGKSATAKLRIQMVGTPPVVKPTKPSIAKNDRVHMFPGKFEIADINVLRNDKLHGPVKVTVSTQPRIGKAKALDNGRIHYDRRGKGYGTDRFTYTITDSAGRTSTAVVLVETPRKS